MNNGIKLLIIFILLVLITAVAISCKGNQNNRTQIDIEDIGQLYLDGRIIDDVAVIFTKDHVSIPLLQVLNELNCSIEWMDENSATIHCNSVVYSLNLDDRTLICEGSDYNLLHPAYGANSWHCEVMPEDVLLDIVTLKTVLLSMGQQLYFYPDYDNSVLEIKRNKTGDGSLS